MKKLIIKRKLAQCNTVINSSLSSQQCNFEKLLKMKQIREFLGLKPDPNDDVSRSCRMFIVHRCKGQQSTVNK